MSPLTLNWGSDLFHGVLIYKLFWRWKISAFNLSSGELFWKTPLLSLKNKHYALRCEKNLNFIRVLFFSFLLEILIDGEIRKISFVVLVHNHIHLSGTYVSGLSMRNVRATSSNATPVLNLHMLMAYDVDSVPYCMVLAPAMATQESSNTFVSNFVNSITTPRGILMPFAGVDQHSTNATEESCPVLYSMQHLIGNVLQDFAHNIVISYGGVRFSRAQVIDDGDLIFEENDDAWRLLSEWLQKLAKQGVKRNYQ